MTKNLILRWYKYFVIFLILTLCGCKKLIEIRPPASSITTKQVFQDPSQADAAIKGIYGALAYGQSSTLNFGTGAFSIYMGAYSDELIAQRPNDLPYYRNEILPTNGTLAGAFWNTPFKILYQIAASMEGIEESQGIPLADRALFLAELKFLRAFCNYQMITIFGDIPWVTSSDWAINSKLPRKNKDEILGIILADLVSASEILPKHFNGQSGERTRASSWACFALASRICLQQKDWVRAKMYSQKILEATDVFELESNLDLVFSTKSREAILQWDNSSTNLPPFNATTEQYVVNIGVNRVPFFYFPETFLNIFDTADKRLLNWIKKYTYRNQTYAIPFKYKLGQPDAVINGPVTEYYTVFRLGEQILIYAEASAQLGNLNDSITAINQIRKRANINTLDENTSGDETLSAILQERRKELFCEWGLRFEDLKRFGIASDVLSSKPGWQERSILLPIPYLELRYNTALKQNPGYN